MKNNNRFGRSAGLTPAWLVLLTALVFPASAMASLITDGDFESGVGVVSSAFVVGNAATYGIWLDVNEWQRVADPVNPGNHYARHVTNGNLTNQLFQGFDATGLAAGTELQLSFDYIFEAGGGVRSVLLYGMNAGGTLSQFAPWPVTNGSILQTWSLGVTPSWTTVNQTYTLADDYAALVLAFRFSSSNDPERWPALRAVDNVRLTATTVPAPVPLALIGTGLLLGALMMVHRGLALGR